MTASMLASSDMTPDEAAVRSAYAKLSFAVDLNTAYQAVTANPNIDAAALAQQVEREGLRFKLSHFKCGDLAEIAKQSYGVLGQYPDGQDVIMTSPVSSSLIEGTAPEVLTEMASATWAQGPNGTPPNATVGELLPIMEQESGVSRLRRYCTFTATATLGGRSRTYQAHFLFGGENRIAPGDVVVAAGGGALETFISHPLYPDILLRTSLWNKPAVHAFLMSTQRTETSCRVNVGDVCCNANTLQCGVASADLQRQP
jgi:hypothetical protein